MTSFYNGVIECASLILEQLFGKFRKNPGLNRLAQHFGEDVMTREPHHKTIHKNRHTYVLAIDLGSGGHKIALVSDTGHVVASADEQITTLMLPGGGAEQDPEEWWQKT